MMCVCVCLPEKNIRVQHLLDFIQLHFRDQPVDGAKHVLLFFFCFFYLNKKLWTHEYMFNKDFGVENFTLGCVIRRA